MICVVDKGVTFLAHLVYGGCEMEAVKYSKVWRENITTKCTTILISAGNGDVTEDCSRISQC